MNFLKNFFMQHPILSLIAVFAIADRVEDHVMMNRALKNGMEYHGSNWNVTIGPANKETKATVKDGDTF